MIKTPQRSSSIKNAPLNFIKNVTSPRQLTRQPHTQTSKCIRYDNNLTADHFNKPSPQNLIIQVSLDKPLRLLKLTFAYSSETSIQELTMFIKKQLNQKFIYFKARDVNVEYLLTLPWRKVRELENKRLEIFAVKIKINKQGLFLNNLEVIKCVGAGGFSRVYLCRGYGRLMALKVISKQFIIQNEKQNIVQSQKKILQKCNGHPFITQLYMSFQTANYLFFCMEYCNGGELFNLLRKEQAKFYFLQTLAAISYLHSQQILYRDLKPENVIIDSEGHIRLADYGLSKIMQENMTHSFCGSAQYMAPEMLLKKGHSYEIDYYCLGALLYELLIGLPPYYSRNQNELFHNILTQGLQFPSNIQLSNDLKKILLRLLEKDTDLRFKNTADILAHPWLKGCSMDDVLSKKLNPPFKTQMFQSNFDNSDFTKDQQTEILKIQRQKLRGKALTDVCFPNFSYKSNSFVQLQKQIEFQEQKRIDFSKKPSLTFDHCATQKEILWRNGSMRSIDNSQLLLEKYQRKSPVFPLNTNKSNRKEKVNPTSQITSFSAKISQVTTPNKSQIMSLNTSGQKSISNNKLLLGTRSVPNIEKDENFSKGSMRMGSPININNYINIYTSKSPSRQINFNSHHFISPQSKKTVSYGCSFQKIINGCSLNNIGIHSNSQKEMGQNFSQNTPILKINAYQHNRNDGNRGYLTNFKQRFNPMQKIKNSYRVNEKSSMNTSNSPFQC